MYRWLMAAFGAVATTTWANEPSSNAVDDPMAANVTYGLPAATLPQSIREKMAVAGLSDDEVSFWVEPLDGGLSNAANATTRLEPIIRHRADKLRTPASTQKLITTFIALHTLGENHRWITRIHPKGVIMNGTLYGDLVIQGFGDPAMTHDRLRAMLRQVEARGIRHIQGDIIIDNSAFQDVKFNVNAFDGQGMRAYNAAPNAFLVNFGTVEIDVLPSGHDEIVQTSTGQATKFVPSDHQSAALQVLPPLADFSAPSQISANDTRCLSENKFHLSDEKLTVFGGTRADCGRQSYWLTFSDADKLAIKAVKGIWQSIDERFTGRVRIDDVVSPGIAWLIYPSKPLSEQIYLINQYSNNVMTEQVALSLPLSMGVAGVHDPASDYPSVLNFISKWWQTHLSSQPPMMSRASGLCRDCAITPAAMAELLAFAYQQPNFEVFKASLPIAGQSGTMMSLSERDPEHPAIGHAHIKTGTLNNVKSLAGYVMDTQGRWYVFVGMINAPGVGYSDHATAVLDEALSYVAKL